MSWLNVVWLRHEHVVAEAKYACFVVVGESAPKVNVFMGPVVGAMVLDGVKVVVVKSRVVWRELVVLWIGNMVDFLPSYDAQLLVVNLSVLDRAGVQGAQPTPLDFPVACNMCVANNHQYCEGRADEQHVDC